MRILSAAKNLIPPMLVKAGIRHRLIHSELLSRRSRHGEHAITNRRTTFAPLRRPRHLRICRESGFDGETGLGEALFEDRYPVMAPERFAFEDEERYAEDVIGFRLLLRATVGEGALALEIFAILFGGETQIRDQRGDGIRLVGFELAAKKNVVRLAAVMQQRRSFC